ncbi:mitochondrial ribosomal small subunit component [Elasticomyces elasticus]|nr:mitochondrial ribosomal small subunit component [Elasticomyces elasticus]
MGRYNLAPQRVQSHATALLSAGRLATPPPWYPILSQIPPSAILSRPALQRSQRPGSKPGKKSRLFKPLRLNYEEDRLRWEYFNDHPWELAKPRVVLEDEGRDGEKYDWSVPLDHSLRRPKMGSLSEEGIELDQEWDRTAESQAGRPINGEAVVQRTNYLLKHSSGHTHATASAQALSEFARLRHYQETTLRIAREEAQSTGAFFGAGPNEVGMKLEDVQYENWREWAGKQIEALRQLQGSAYTGNETETSESAGEAREGLQEVAGSVPGSKRGQEARGGAAVHA